MRANHALTLLLTLLVLLMPPAARAGKLAASIEYDSIPRPAGLPESLQPTQAASLEFLSLTPIDGRTTQAALWQPVGRAPADTTLIIMIHGSGDNFHNAPQGPLAPLLAAKGYATLAINTRQHDSGLNTDNFLEIRRDIEAAVATARALGFKRLVLQGHSLGNIQVQYFAANNWDPDIKGVILLGAFGNLPWKSQTILVANDPLFKKLIAESLAALRAGTIDQPLPDQMPYNTAASTPVTAQHFLTYRWDKTSVADGTFWIKRIPKPILLVRDQADGLVAGFESQMLIAAAHAEGSLNTSTEFHLLANPGPPSLAGHRFVNTMQPLADTILAWLSDQKL